jgi:hypothetical protein
MISYWLLRESGIPISPTTVQQKTNDERSTSEMRSRISKYEDKLKTTFELPTVDQSKIINLESKDPAFFDEFMRTIVDDAALRHANDQVTTYVADDN